MKGDPRQYVRVINAIEVNLESKINGYLQNNPEWTVAHVTPLGNGHVLVVFHIC